MASNASNLDYLMRPTPAQLLETATLATPTDRLRKVLLHACSSSQATAEILRGLLIVGGPPPVQVVDLTDEDHDSVSKEDTGSEDEGLYPGDDWDAYDDHESGVDEYGHVLDTALSTNSTLHKRKRSNDDEEKSKSPAKLPTDIRSILNPVSINPQPAKKHRLNGSPRPRYLMCENCEKEYDVTANDLQPCRYHEGNKEVYDEEDFWADDDYPVDFYDFVDEPDYQRGFIWDCCDLRADNAEGCIKDSHRNKLDV